MREILRKTEIYDPLRPNDCVPMEGATVFVASYPVDIIRIYQGLLEISMSFKLLNEKATNYVSLECLTIDLIKEAHNTKRHYMDLVFALLELWFPSLSAGLNKSGASWSSYWDLDLIVHRLLNDAGYPDDMPALTDE